MNTEMLAEAYNLAVGTITTDSLREFLIEQPNSVTQEMFQPSQWAEILVEIQRLRGEVPKWHGITQGSWVSFVARQNGAEREILGRVTDIDFATGHRRVSENACVMIRAESEERTFFRDARNCVLVSSCSSPEIEVQQTHEDDAGQPQEVLG